MMRLFDHIDSMPDLQFMALFVLLIVIAYAAEWVFDRWTNKGGRELKKLILVIVLLAIASTSDAFSIGNLRFSSGNYWPFGGNHSHKNKNITERKTPEPNPPVHNVPEPATAILLGGGILAVAAWKRRKG